MMIKLFSKLRTLFFLLSFYLVSCSKDIENLPLNEQAIYQSDRFSEDIVKDRYRKPLDILNFSGLKPGMTVVDILGGGGYYSELFNYIVGDEGGVYLQNNSLFLKFSQKELDKRLLHNRLQNVIRLDSEYANMKLPENVDMVFAGLSFHDFYVEREDPVISANPEAFFAQVMKALKPGGTLIIIDHSAIEGSGISHTSKLHRIDEVWVKNEMESRGFTYSGSLDVLRNPNDNRTLDIWKEEVFQKTDRFIHKYTKRVSQ